MRTGRLTIFCLLMSVFSTSAGQPIARFQSVLGNFDVLLDPIAAPRTVANFTSYANRAAYDSTIIHRSTTKNPFDIQIVQGGGFQLVSNTLPPIPTDPPIPLEAGKTNARGTLAMARTTAPDSATSQWYFNVTDNPDLDFEYAVFGRVLGRGQDVINAMGSVETYDLRLALNNGALGQMPLFTPDLLVSDLVLISAIRVAPFAITNITRTGTNTELRWTTLSTNTPVRVERTTDLIAGSWTAVGSNLTTGIFTDANPPTNAVFYRVVVEP